MRSDTDALPDITFDSGVGSWFTRSACALFLLFLVSAVAPGSSTAGTGCDVGVGARVAGVARYKQSSRIFPWSLESVHAQLYRG